jgi:site-specific recombinase XerD
VVGRRRAPRVPAARRAGRRPTPVCAAQLRHAHALERAREGAAEHDSAQLGHANLGTTSIYLQGIDPEEIIATVCVRRAPMMVGHRRLRI